jgi:hypothetical protein
MQTQAIRLSKLALAVIAIHPAFAVAAPGAGSAYLTDSQYSHVEDATSKGIGQVNMITCFMGAMRPDALVNMGNYLALVDKTKCDPEARSSTSNSSSTNGGSQAADYMTATVNSSRASNSDPMIAKVWVDETDEGRKSVIFVRVAATQAPSTTNPYGQFRLDFCGKDEGGGACMSKGFLQGSDSGMSFFQMEAGGGNAKTVALQLSTSGTTSGSGKMQIDGDGQQIGYSFAYDQNYFRRSDGTTDQCFSRDAADADTGMSIWRYGLYDASSGARVTRSSGFPIEYTANGQTYHGYLGYWGLSLPPDVQSTLSSGATVVKVDYSAGESPTKTNYTVVKADGKLMKYTKKTRTLHELDKIKFTTFVDMTPLFSGAQLNTQYELYWDDTAGAFKVSGQMNCSNNGCETLNLDSEKSVSPSYWATRGGVQGWSQALGGELFIDLQGAGDGLQSSGISVVYRTQDLVYPSAMPAALNCLSNCPTAAALASYFASGSTDQSPFAASSFNNWGPTSADSVVTYTSDSANALLKDATSQAVTFTNRDALQQHQQYQSGVRSGRLFANLADAECTPASGTYCDYKVNTLETYYVWETGPNNWNQFAAVKDNNGSFVNFDPPLQVTYNVPTGAAYGQYAGKAIVLQYGGFGELWGIPGHCVSRLSNENVSCDTQDSRYVPAFVIPFDAVTGQVTSTQSSYLAKWLDREIRFAKKDLSVCTTAGLVLPSGITLPTAAGLKDPSDPNTDIYIGAKPTVTAAARVIQGDVKF